MTWWLVVVLVVGFGYLAVALGFAARQDALFFKPKRELAATPDRAGLAWEPVVITAEDQVEISCWWLPGPEEPAPGQPGRPFTMLYLHGANTNLGDRVDALQFWQGLGFDILAVEYRGYGESSGRPSEAGLKRDVQAAWDWLVQDRGVPAGHVVLAAESMGVSLATALGRGVRPAGMILEAGFTRAVDVAARRYPWLPVRQMLRLDLAAEDHIAQVRSPVLLVHSVDDTLVPITLGRRLERRARPPREFLKIRGAHARACVEGGPRYRAGVQRWLSDLEVHDAIA